MHHQRELDDKADAMRRNIGDALRAQCERQGFNQSDVAQKASVSRATVIAAESGQSVSTSNLFRMAAAVGLNFTPQPEPAMIATASRRPTLKQLMRAERERQAMLQANSPSRRVVESASFTAPAPPLRSSAPRRPTLKEMMRAERERQAMLQADHLHKLSQ